MSYLGALRPENAKLLGEFDIRYSGIEILRFYDFGNSTSADISNRRSRVRNEQFRVAPSIDMLFLSA